MKHWPLYILKMLARGGLSAALTLWVVGQQGDTRVGIPPTSRLVISTDIQFAQLLWLPNSLAEEWYDEWRAFILMQAYGARGCWIDWTLPPVWLMRRGGERPTIFLIDHWFLCVTFLIATVGTHCGWKRKAVEQARANA